MSFLNILKQRRNEILLIAGMCVLMYTPASPLQILIFPGILLYTKHTRELFTQLEKATLAGFLSLAFWVVSFAFLKYIPLPLTTFMMVVQFCCFVYLFTKGIAHERPYYQKGDWVLLFGFLSIFLPYIFLYNDFHGPVGNDMGIISYTATVISSANKYPTTYVPLLPIDHFGFAPIGFSVLSAMITLLSTIPIYKALLLLSVLSYPIYWAALYLYLSNFYSKYKSFVITYIVFIVGQHVRGFFPWGGNITIWSIAFLIVAIWLYIRLKQRAYSPKYLSIVALLIAASFYTHQVALLGFAFFAFVYVFTTIIRSPNRITTCKQLGLLGALIIAFLFPFLSSTNLPSPDTVAFVKHYLQTAPYYTMSSDLGGLFTSVPIFISKEIGSYLMLYFVVGMGFALLNSNKNDLWHFIAVPIFWLIIANTKLWFLPFSFGLYPDRILGLFTIVYAYFIGRTLPELTNFHPLPTQSKMLLSMFMVISVPFLLSMHVSEYTRVRAAGKLHASVTDNDVAAFAWILKNTKSSDIIENNEGDAGIWLPVYTRRMITRNDSSPHIFDELFLAQSMLRPAYAYVGDKVSYPEAMPHPAGYYDNANYSLVFSQGNAKVYKVHPSAHKKRPTKR